MRSAFLTLDVKDVLRGLAFAVGGAVYATLDAAIGSGGAIPSAATIWLVAKGAAVTYIGHRFFSNSQGGYGKEQSTGPSSVVTPKTATSLIDGKGSVGR